MTNFVLNRRAFIVMSGLLIGCSGQETQGKAGLRSIRLQDFVPPNRPSGTDQTWDVAKVLARLGQAARAGQPLHLTAGPGIWQISDDFVIDWDGFTFEGSGSNTVFVQRSQSKGLFRLFGDHATIGGFKKITEGELSEIPGHYFGFGAHQRTAAAVIHGSWTTVHDIEVVNSHTAICARGPVAGLRQARRSINKDYRSMDADNVGFDWSINARGNVIQNISASGCQIGISGNQQDDWTVSGIVGRNAKKIEIPPHLIYIEPGGSKNMRGSCRNVSISSIDDSGNIYSNSVKIEGLHGFTLSIEKASGTSGVITMNKCSDGKITIGDCTNIGGNSTEKKSIYGAQVNASDSVIINAGKVMGAPGALLQGAFVGNASDNIEINNMTVTSYGTPSGKANYGFQVRKNSRAKFNNCSLNGLGDNPMFYCDDSSQIDIYRAVTTKGREMVKASRLSKVRILD